MRGPLGAAPSLSCFLVASPQPLIPSQNLSGDTRGSS